jgi:hypothetical protein
MDFASVFKQFSEGETPEPPKSLSAISEAKAAETAALVEEMERAEFIEAQIIPEPAKAEAAPTEPPEPPAPAPPTPAAPPIPAIPATPAPRPRAVTAEPPFITEPIAKGPPAPNPFPPTQKVEADSSPLPSKSASGPGQVRDVEELARAIADLGKNPGGSTESPKLSSSIQGAKVIEAEVVEPGSKNAGPGFGREIGRIGEGGFRFRNKAGREGSGLPPLSAPATFLFGGRQVTNDAGRAPRSSPSRRRR